MNRISIILLNVLMLLWGCKKNDPILHIEQKSGMLVYMIADNNLSYFAVQDINEMEAGISPNNEGQVLVFVDKGINATPSHPYLLEIVHDTTDKIVSKIIRTYAEMNSADKTNLSQVIQYAKEIFTNKNILLDHLILWSHGSGWLPTGYSIYNDSSTKGNFLTKSFGLDEYDMPNQTAPKKLELDINNLATVLNNYHFKTISFDACFMGGVEVAYALRNSCDQIIFSPAEISSTGFPYTSILRKIFSTDNAGIYIAQSVANDYLNRSGDLKSFTISVIKTKYFEKLASLTQKMYQQIANNFLLKDSIPLSRLQQYDRLNSNYYYDFKSLYIYFLKDNIFMTQEFENIWNDIIAYQNHSEKMMGTLSLQNANGLSIYVPQSNNRKSLHQFYTSLAWYADTDKNNFWNIHY